MNKPARRYARPLSDLVAPALGDVFARQGFASGDIVTQWPDIMGEEIARLADPVLVSVPAGVTIDRPVVVVDWIDADGAAVYPRLVVRIGTDADVKVVDWHDISASHPNWFYPDGIHLTPDGAAGYTQLVLDSFRS